jgi:hypothetical protein
MSFKMKNVINKLLINYRMRNTVAKAAEARFLQDKKRCRRYIRICWLFSRLKLAIRMCVFACIICLTNTYVMSFKVKNAINKLLIIDYETPPTKRPTLGKDDSSNSNIETPSTITSKIASSGEGICDIINTCNPCVRLLVYIIWLIDYNVMSFKVSVL